MDWVREEKHVHVDKISIHFGVTPQTIRRDIKRLCDEGLLRRHYGGVSLPVTLNLPRISDSASAIEIFYQIIARQIAQLIPNGASVSLAGGDAVVYVAKALLKHDSLKVLTNSLAVASALSSNSDLEVIVSGGQYRHADNDMVGPEVTNFFSSFFSDYGIISAGSIDPVHGLMDYDIREAEANRAVISNTRTKILLADQDKWEKSAMCKVATFKYIDMFFTDRLPDEIVNKLPKTLEIFESNLVRTGSLSLGEG